ncbi:MAG: ABC transporter ATP-binding protein [Chloroflexota bacterium]
MRVLWKLRKYLQKYWPQVTLALLTLLGITAVQLVLPNIIRQVIDIGLGQGKARYLLVSAAVILGLGVVQAGLTFIRQYTSEWISHHVAYDVRNHLYNHIQHLSFSYHDHTQSGQLISRCIEDVRSIQQFTGSGVVELLHMSILAISIITILLIENTQLAAIALLPIIPLFFATIRFGQKVSPMFYRVDYTLGELSTRLQENVIGAQVVRAFAREPYEIKRFDTANRELYDARITVIREWSRVMPTTALLITLSTILIIWFGGQSVLHGDMTLGEVVAFNSYMLLLAQPVQQLAWLVNSAGEAAAGTKRIWELLNVKPDIQSPPDSIALPELSGYVEFHNVSFKYLNEEKYALRDINLKVEPKQIIALIGPTGSGKTTLVNLIPRFYDCHQGSVRIDGRNVREVDLVSLRKQIGIVLQTSLLFSATIKENIAYGRPEADEKDIIAAATAAEAHEFITSFSNGYDTIVGERGITLSGGQRQRVAIARALLMDPRILILDDATSSVDTETEYQIQQALVHLMEGRTTFVIAQRLSTVKRADLIIVMDEGRIIERGTHDVLLRQDGLYRQIYDLQLRDQEKVQVEREALRT